MYSTSFPSTQTAKHLPKHLPHLQESIDFAGHAVQVAIQMMQRGP